ncbi:MAG: hypothetical protein KF699_09525 [Phycisphaeraceae bacterium]|nr:hypothetical protein [Phycisphaeraceae bacterium]
MTRAARPAAAEPRAARPRTRSVPAKIAGISSAAVEKATGKPWDHWLEALDKAGAANMAHKDIAVLLSKKFGVADWWAQMVTVGYEQARGRREAHQTARGFSASASKTIGAAPVRVFRAWTDTKARNAWLPGAPLTIRKATAPKSIRVTWTRPPARTASEPRQTSIEIWISDKSKPGAPKCAVQVQESKLRSAAEVAASKKHWSAALGRLAEALE